MGKIAEAYVEVSAKTARFDKGLDDSKSRLTEWVGSAQKLVAAFVIARVGQEFLSFIGSAIKASSDLAESANKAGVAFGDSFTKVNKYVDEMANKFGFVKSEIYDVTAGIGFMLVNAGLAKDVVADLAISLTRSAADTTSLMNPRGGIKEVLDKIKSGISGEAEPLRVYGVNVMEGNVEKQARAMGFVNSQLTDRQKILARIALITAGLSQADGDLAKTAGEYANMTRKAAGDWENLKAVLGDELKPIALELIKAGYDLGDAFKDAFGKSGIEAFVDYMRQSAALAKEVRVGLGGKDDDAIDMAALPDQWAPGIDPGVRSKAEQAGIDGRKKTQAIWAKLMADQDRRRMAVPRGAAELGGLLVGAGPVSDRLRGGLAAMLPGPLAGIVRAGGGAARGLAGMDTFEARWAMSHPRTLDRNGKMNVADFHDAAQEMVFKRAEDDAQEKIAKNTAHASEMLDLIQKNGAELLKKLPGMGAILRGPS